MSAEKRSVMGIVLAVQDVLPDGWSEGRKDTMVRTPAWFVPAVAALMLWGVWGLFQKLATNQMTPRNVYLAAVLGMIVVAFVVFAMSGVPLQMNARGVFLALLAGICSSLGGFLFLHAISIGKASVVIP